MLGYKFENIAINRLTPGQYHEIKKAIPEHGVICIKHQQLNNAYNVFNISETRSISSSVL